MEQETDLVPTYHLEPGYIYVSREKATIRTVLGSCVAVCIWDKVKKWGGMNHYLYPEVKEPGKTTAQYGNVAIPGLLKLIAEMGSVRTNLTAQIFGGAALRESSRNTVGAENVAIAREILGKKKIRILSEDIGGSMGRKILFDTETGHAAIFKVHRLRTSDWISGKIK